MAIQLNSHTTVRDLVGRFPQTRQVFEEFEVDYCCGGGRSLADAAADRSVNVASLMDALTDALESPPKATDSPERDWYAAPLSDLIEHIIETHHSYVRAALPRLRSLTAKVLIAHREHHEDVLSQVQTHVHALESELRSHMMKEEQVLFPYIVVLEQHIRAGTAPPQAPFGSIENPVRQMEQEHEFAGNALMGIRQVTGGYAQPDDGCQTFQALYEQLQRFEGDLHQHIHLENNILFPRAMELEKG